MFPFLHDMNLRILSFLCLVFLGLTIAATQHYADEFALYWHWWWLDIIMHYLGGVFVAFLFLWSYLSMFQKLPKRLVILGVVVLVGILWEVYEYVMGATDVYFESYRLDTAMDMFFDILGAITVAYLVLKQKIKDKSFVASPTQSPQEGTRLVDPVAVSTE